MASNQEVSASETRMRALQQGAHMKAFKPVMHSNHTAAQCGGYPAEEANQLALLGGSGLCWFTKMTCCAVVWRGMLAHAEMASSNLQHDQLQREVKQLQALAAEKDGRLAEAAAEEQRLRQQLDQLHTQLQQAGG